MSTGKQLVTWMAPLYAWDKVVLISSWGHLWRLLLKADVSQLHPRLRHHSCAVERVVIPDINIEVSSTSSGKNLLVRTPSGVHYFTLMLIDNHNTWPVVLKRYFIASGLEKTQLLVLKTMTFLDYLLVRLVSRGSRCQWHPGSRQPSVAALRCLWRL